VLNLLVNAMDAMSGVNSPERQLLIQTHCEAGQEVHVVIHDAGPGIPPAQLSRLFEPFVTTKVHGMGMGLVISRTIIETHSGRLWAVNNPEGGATFHITLPVYRKSPEL
jgi:C4-dicarboxylate-specific signal transduction histidine kinase